MEIENKAYSTLFERYGSPSRNAEITLRGYLALPGTLDTFDRIRHMDDSAARLIADCKRLVTQLSAYRQDLAARYNDLATMLSRDQLVLERVPSYSGKITYYIRFFTVYEDGTRCETASERYDGKARHKAIARFEALKKERRNAEFIKDIAKKQWER